MATATVPRGTKTNGSKPPDLEALREPPVGATGQILQIPLELIDTGPNVRVNVAEIDELAASIAEHGVLQPIKVRDAAGDRYLVTWGQRRVLAARKAGLERIPALVGESDQAIDKLSIEQLVENLHRADLNPIDRAQAMQAVVGAGVSQADLARKLGIGASTVANDLGLLEAPKAIQDLIEKGELTASHAKAFKGLAPKTQSQFARDAIEYGWSAHETERRVQGWHQSAERERERLKADKAEAKKRDEATTAKLAELAKKIPLDTPIRVSAYSYGSDNAIDRAVTLIQSAGFTKVTKGRAQERPRGFCDCTAYRAELGYYGAGISLEPGCIVEAHYNAKQKADNEAWRAKSALQGKVRAKLAEVLVDQVAGLGPLAARIALWRLLGWEIDGWTKKVDPGRSGRKRNPWASITELDVERLRAEVTSRLASGLSDGNFKVDWEGLAAELGLTGNAEPAAAAAADGSSQA